MVLGNTLAIDRFTVFLFTSLHMHCGKRAHFHTRALGRVLGYQGVTAICGEIKRLSHRIEPFRKKDLSTVNLNENKDMIVELFDEVSNIVFNSKRGRAKKVGPTARALV